MNINGSLAFPQKEPMSNDEQGMSLRDYFAAKALNGICAFGPGMLSCKSIAKESYRLADAMIEARLVNNLINEKKE